MKAQIKQNTLLLERIVFAVFILYLEWYKEIWGDVPAILYGTTALLTGLVLWRMLGERYFLPGEMPPILKMYFLYFIYSFTGLIVAKDMPFMVSSLITYGCFVVVCFDCWYISSKIGNHDWVYKTFKYVAVVCMLQVIIHGQPYWNGVWVTTMSSTNNPNTLGLILLIGILSFALTTNNEKTLSFVIALCANVAMLYAIILTGSRKCLLAATAVCIFWLISYTRMMFGRHMRKKFFVVLLCAIVAGYLCMSYIDTYFQDSAAFERLTQLFQEGGTSARVGLYEDAIEFWKTSPIIGIGFRQYQVWSSHGFFSHSSYAEVLSCGGIVGILIFYIPLLKCLYACTMNEISKNTDKENTFRTRMVLLFLLCELFIGLGQIFLYDILHLLVLMLISMSVIAGEQERLSIERGYDNV